MGRRSWARVKSFETGVNRIIETGMHSKCVVNKVIKVWEEGRGAKKKTCAKLVLNYTRSLNLKIEDTWSAVWSGG